MRNSASDSSQRGQVSDTAGCVTMHDQDETRHHWEIMCGLASSWFLIGADLWGKHRARPFERLRIGLSHMARSGVTGPSSSNSDDGSHDCTPVPDSSRHTSHTGKQSRLGGLGYGVCVAWHHLRPFIPFFLISFMVVALVYLMQAIIFGGPFKDPLFFVKFNERWPRPAPVQEDSPADTEVFSKAPSSSLKQILFELQRNNETMSADWSQKWMDFFLSLLIWATRTLQGLHQVSVLIKGPRL